MGHAFPPFPPMEQSWKDEMKRQTIFNLISRSDLQGSFDRISTMLVTESSTSDKGQSQDVIFVRASFSHRSDLGLQITPVRGPEGEMRHFSLTLMQVNHSVPPVVATVFPLPTEFCVVDSTALGAAASKENGSSRTHPHSGQVDSPAFRIIG